MMYFLLRNDYIVQFKITLFYLQKKRFQADHTYKFIGLLIVEFAPGSAEDLGRQRAQKAVLDSALNLLAMVGKKPVVGVRQALAAEFHPEETADTLHPCALVQKRLLLETGG